MRSHQLSIGRTFGIAFDNGEDFYPALDDVCRTNGIQQGDIPMFIAGFAEVEIVGTCGKIDNPEAPWMGPASTEPTSKPTAAAPSPTTKPLRSLGGASERH